jgi:quercetin dioxygenase-like cupin family protein
MRNRWLAVGVLCIGLVAVPGSTRGDVTHIMVKPGDLTWSNVPPAMPAGAQIVWIEGKPADAAPFTFRLKLPANYRIAPHWHPAIEHVTVLSGSFNIGMGERLDPQKVETLPAGSFVALPPKTAHFVMNKEAAVLQVHGVGPWALTYVNPEDDPRNKK